MKRNAITLTIPGNQILVNVGQTVNIDVTVKNTGNVIIPAQSVMKISCRSDGIDMTSKTVKSFIPINPGEMMGFVAGFNVPDTWKGKTLDALFDYYVSETDMNNNNPILVENTVGLIRVSNVINTIRGNITRIDGLPIILPSPKIQITPEIEGPTAIGNVYSDGNGNFKFENLTFGGNFTLKITHPSYSDFIKAYYYPGGEMSIPPIIMAAVQIPPNKIYSPNENGGLEPSILDMGTFSTEQSNNANESQRQREFALDARVVLWIKCGNSAGIYNAGNTLKFRWGCYNSDNQKIVIPLSYDYTIPTTYPGYIYVNVWAKYNWGDYQAKNGIFFVDIYLNRVGVFPPENIIATIYYRAK